ncbi:MAG: hypothetical protein ACOCXA_02165 [Planctomycetota bacterium]
MNKLRPYLFWIISVVVLVIVTVVGMSQQPNEGRMTVQRAVRDLDRKYSDLEEMADKASNRISSYATDDPDEFARLQKDYLITSQWESGLEELRSRYRDQVERIQAELVRLSEVLDDPIKAQAQDAPDWYFEYERQTAQLLWSHYQDGLFEGLPEGLSESDFMTNATYRRPFGLYTKEVEYPQASMWDTLATRFRIVEQITVALAKVEATPQQNPLVAEFVPEPAPSRPRVAAIEWEGGGSLGSIGRPTPATGMVGGDVTAVVLRLRGSPTALLAASAALDELVAPMVAIRGVTWQSDPMRSRSGENPDDVPMQATYHLMVLRFDEAALAAIGGR